MARSFKFTATLALSLLLAPSFVRAMDTTSDKGTSAAASTAATTAPATSSAAYNTAVAIKDGGYKYTGAEFAVKTITGALTQPLNNEKNGLSEDAKNLVIIAGVVYLVSKTETGQILYHTLADKAANYLGDTACGLLLWVDKDKQESWKAERELNAEARETEKTVRRLELASANAERKTQIAGLQERAMKRAVKA